MADEDMARVKITKTVVVTPNPTSTALYQKGWEGVAPRAHIEQIVANGAGEAVDAHKAQPQPDKVSK